MTIAEQIVRAKNDYYEVYNAGNYTERENFWHNVWYEPDGSLRTYYRNAFGTWCNVNTFKPIYLDEVIQITGTNGIEMFKSFNRNRGADAELLDMSEFCRHFDFSGITTADSLFRDARVKNVTVNLEDCTNMSYAFAHVNGGAFENITLKVSGKCTNYTNAFANTTTLKTITFTDDSLIAANIGFAQSKSLTKESIISIINALSADATNKTLTLNKIAVVAAFGTDYDSSTEWTTLKNSKSNWTIALS